MDPAQGFAHLRRRTHHRSNPSSAEPQQRLPPTSLATWQARQPKKDKEHQVIETRAIAGRTRPLDEMTRCALLHWLDYRRTRWRTTVNPHLLVNMRTALAAGPVRSYWLNITFRGYDATLDRLRMDRQLEEALTHRAGPLNLVLVFGLDEKTAIRYANSARQLLATAAECDTSG